MSGIDIDGRPVRLHRRVPSGRLNGSTPFWNTAPTERQLRRHVHRRAARRARRRPTASTRRVFSMGMSNGAQMSSLLACRLPDRIRAIGTIAGEEYLEPCDGRPVPDHGVPRHGGPGREIRRRWPQRHAHRRHRVLARARCLPACRAMGIDESMRRWAKHNGCDPNSGEERLTDEVRVRTWTGCTAPRSSTSSTAAVTRGRASRVRVRGPVRTRARRHRRARALIFGFFFEPPDR